MLTWTVLVAALMVQCLANYTAEEVESFLNNLYLGTTRTGCETPIKCTYARDASGNGSDTRCCYDCASCVGDRCYRGWQCCRDSGQGRQTLVDDSLLYYADVPLQYVRCEKLFRYEKRSYGAFMYETGVNESTASDGPNSMDHDPVTYQMISTCPPQFTDTEIVALCENTTRLGSILNLMPFISKSKKQLYKNRYCVQCHNGHTFSNTEDTFVPLNLLLSAEEVYYKYLFINMFETVYDVMNFTVPVQFSNNETDLRIVLQASTQFLKEREFEAQTIPPCGIEIDPGTECVEIYGYNNTLLRNACKMFYSPVRVRIRSYTYIARNLACARCRGGSYITDTFSWLDRGYEGPQPLPCTSEMAPGPSIVMNIQPAFDELSAPSEGIGNQRLIGIVLGKRDGFNCQTGLFWDAITRQCRHILCPRRHYIYRGKCEPIYKETSRHSYYVKIKVTPTDPVAVIYQDMIRQQEEQLMTVIVNKTNMNLCFRRISGKAKSETQFAYVIYTFALVPFSRMRYLSVLSKLKFIFDKSLPDILLKRTSLFDNYHIEGGDILHYYKTNIYPITTPSDSNDGTALVNVMHQGTHWYIIGKCGGLIDISKQDFCYRVRLEPHEYKIDLVKSVPRLNVITTGRIIYRDNYDILLDDSAMVCIEDYVTQWQPDLDRGQTQTDVTTNDEDSPRSGNTVFVTIIAATFGFVTIATLISRFHSIIQWCKHPDNG